MNDPAGALAARIEEFERAADPGLVMDDAASADAEQAMRGCAGDLTDAATWRLIGVLHLARYRLGAPGGEGEAAVAGVFFAAVAVLDPAGLPAKLRGPHLPSADTPETWAALVEEVLRHVDPDGYPHVGLLLHALIRRAVRTPSEQACDRLGEVLLQEATGAAWAPEALSILGGGLMRLFGTTGRPEALDDAIHVHFRAALAASGNTRHLADLAAALGLAAPGDDELIGAYLAAAQRRAGSQERSQALLVLLDLAQARAAESCVDADLLGFIRAGQAALDFWHEARAHPGVLAGYAAGLVEWYVVTGDERSLEAAREMLEALGAPAQEVPERLGRDPVARLDLLANRRWRRWRVGDDPADLEIAIQTLRQAAARAYAGHPDRPRVLANLANALVHRAIRGGHPGEAIAAARSAVAACGPDDPLRPNALLLLGQALRLDLSMSAADEAVAALREALEQEQAEPFQAEAHALVSEVLRWRAMAGEERQEADLDDAVLAARQAADAAAKSSHNQPVTMGALAKALLLRFTVRGDTGDLAEALVLASSAPQSDLELRSQLGRVLEAADRLPGAPGEHLAQAATRLALVSDDEEAARVLLRIGERHARAAGEAGPFLAATAVQLAERERFRLAIELLERAGPVFAAAGDPAEAADALSRIGRHHEELGEWEQALRAFERSAAAYRDLGESLPEASQAGHMGAVAARAGEPRRAIEFHLRAADLCGRAGLAGQEATHRGHAAGAGLAAGDHAAALECAGRARELHLAAGETERAATVLISGARAHAGLGDLPAAAELITTCAAELEAIGAWDDACQALDSHALLLYALGHPDHAAACEASIVDIVRRRGQRLDPADEWFHIARRRRARGDLPAARRAFELAERAYNTLGHADGIASVRYNLGALGHGENAAEQAAQDFGTAAEAFARLQMPVREAAARTMRGACLTELGRFDGASAELGRALELAAGETDLAALFSVTLAQAELSMAAGRLPEAEERLFSALGTAAADPVREAIVRERMALLAARTGDPEGEIEALGMAAAGFRAGGRPHLGALAAIRLGLALEELGDLARARTALEEGLAGLGPSPARPPADAPYELMAARDPDPWVLTRLAAIQLALGESARGRSTLARALAAARRGAGPSLADELAERLRIEEAEAAGDLAGALALARQALKADDDPPRRSRLLSKLARLTLDAGEPAAARDHAIQGRDLGDGHLAEHLVNLGAATRALGHTDEAIDVLTQAVSLARASARPTAPSGAEGGAGPSSPSGDGAAPPVGDRAWASWSGAAALPVRLVEALGALGQALADGGRWAEADAALAEGLMLTTEPAWRAMRAGLLAGRARLRLQRGGLEGAAAGFREAMGIREALGEPAALADDYLGLARVHALRGEEAQAVRLVKRGLEVDRARGRRRAAVIGMINLARLEEPEGARSCLGEALALAQRIGHRQGQGVALGDLGALDVRAGEHARAHERTSVAIELLQEQGHARELALAHHHRSTAAEHLDDLPGALLDAEHACELYEQAADRPSVLDLIEPYEPGRGGAVDVSALRGRAAELAVRLGRAAVAWAHVERAKSQALAAQLGRDPRASWQAAVPGATGVGGRFTAERLQALVTPGLATGAEVRPSTSATTAPGEGAAVGLLGFYVGDVGEGDVTVLAHRTGWEEPRAFATLAGRDLLAEFAGGGLGGPLGDGGSRHRADNWRLLADLLLGDALDALGDDLAVLYLIPHGDLHAMPLHALAPGGRLLLERFPVAYAPSAAMLARRTRRAGAARSLVLGFGADAGEAAAFEREAADVAHLLAAGRDPGSQTGGGPRTGRLATAASLEGAWDVVHLACRAAIDGGDAFGSGIRLADGLLTARTIMDMRIDAELVVLGSCEDAVPAGSRPSGGEGPAGGGPAHGAAPGGPRSAAAHGVAALGHALLHAGARSALLPLWPVAAEVSRALLLSFHARLAEGAGRAAALREATLESREVHGSARPELWAPYVLVGLAA
ncbi:CHAT domain-containing protein [Nonomuraea sp. LPB2021202275-12-8]|uniref:CHAT domain-containing protein n=1 Tax=Nonomuraea sp. LPB2021202275-12-8 TaxID=3120159 RepID=UPI00300C3E79